MKYKGMNDWYSDIEAILSRPRQYAAYFETGGKILKEVRVCHELFNSLSINNNLRFSGLHPNANANDAPDCIAKNEKNEEVALEVTELVNGEIIQRNIKSPQQTVYWDLDTEDFIKKIDEILERKDTKQLSGGVFTEYCVVIHTAETVICNEWEKFSEALKKQSFRTSHIDAAYLLLAYDPNVAYCPVMPINIEKGKP